METTKEMKVQKKSRWNEKYHDLFVTLGFTGLCAVWIIFVAVIF